MTNGVARVYGTTVMRTRTVRASAVVRRTTMGLARMPSEPADGHHTEAGATEDETETINIHDCFKTPMRRALRSGALTLNYGPERQMFP